MAEPIVIYGLGPFAKLMHFYFSEDSPYEVAGFCVDRPYLTRGRFCGLPVLDVEEAIKKWPPGANRMFAAIGYKKIRNRKLMYDKAKDMGYELVSYVSSHAVVWDNCVIGTNNVIMAKVDLEPWVQIGENNIFWSDTLCGHNLKVGSHNYISAKCLLAGDMVIKDLCFVGNGAVTINQITLHDETHLFPGGVLMTDTEPGGRYAGNPAKFIGKHKGEGIVINRG